MKIRMLLIAATAVLALLASGLLQAAPMTNQDVIKMVTAKLDQAIILSAIENSSPGYDASADGLIELSAAKVPQPIIAAIIKRASGKSSSAPRAAGGTPQSGATSGDLMSPSEVQMIDGEQTHSMRYLNPQVRTTARGLGFGGVATYAALRNSAASLRTRNSRPEFLVLVPNQAQPESYFTLASFAVRRNNTREVLVGGGYMSYSTGIHPDRVIAVVSEAIEDQSRAQDGFIIYRVVPTAELPAGEYAVILYTGEVQGMVIGWFTGTGNSYFDFGVDG